MSSFFVLAANTDIIGQYIPDNIITWIAFAAIVIYLFYQFVLKPMGYILT